MMALECACGRKMYPDAALLRCPGCGRPTATMGPCSMTSKPEGREVEAREGGTLQGGGEMSAEEKLRAAIEQAYAAFRADCAARGRPVCDAFEPCKRAKEPGNPWADAPDYTPCAKCFWSKRTHDSGAEAAVRSEMAPRIGALRVNGEEVAIVTGATVRDPRTGDLHILGMVSEEDVGRAVLSPAKMAR